MPFYAKKKPRITIIGRPNVGKSTLFNKLIGKRKAIAFDMPGVTRDFIEGDTQDGKFVIVDTAGCDQNFFLLSNKSVFSKKISEAISMSNQLLFVVEPETTDVDIRISDWVRKNVSIPVLLVVNKCDNNSKSISDFGVMGFDGMVNVSAEHSIGLGDIHDFINSNVTNNIDEAIVEEDSVESARINLVICGQPNVGKSTLMNAVLNEDRVVTHDSPGTTRDSISVDHPKYDFLELTDTSGIRRKSKMNDRIESLSFYSALSSIKHADVIVLVIDATCAMERQDAYILEHSRRYYKPLILVANKWDLIKGEDKSVLRRIKYQCARVMPYGTKIITTSALYRQNCKSIVKECRVLHAKSKIKIKSSLLNKWLQQAISEHSPPMSHRNTPIKIKFISQVRSNPIFFKIHANSPEDIPQHYTSYLSKSLCKYFEIEGVPIKIDFFSSKNPYLAKAS